MKITLTIDSEDAAFDGDDANREVARILRRVANQVDGLEPGDTLDVKLRDINGNTCGDFKLQT